jgi:hypothetical protein
MPLLYFLTRKPCGANRFDNSQSGTGAVQGSRDDKAAATAARLVAGCRWLMLPDDPNVETGADEHGEESADHGRSIEIPELPASV